MYHDTVPCWVSTCWIGSRKEDIFQFQVAMDVVRSMHLWMASDYHGSWGATQERESWQEEYESMHITSGMYGMHYTSKQQS